jgi:hypothetical protein
MPQPDDAIKQLLPITPDMDSSMIAFTQVLRTYCEQLKARASQSTDTNKKNKEEKI